MTSASTRPTSAVRPTRTDAPACGVRGAACGVRGAGCGARASHFAQKWQRKSEQCDGWKLRTSGWAAKGLARRSFRWSRSQRAVRGAPTARRSSGGLHSSRGACGLAALGPAAHPPLQAAGQPYAPCQARTLPRVARHCAACTERAGTRRGLPRPLPAADRWTLRPHRLCGRFSPTGSFTHPTRTSAVPTNSVRAAALAGQKTLCFSNQMRNGRPVPSISRRSSPNPWSRLSAPAGVAISCVSAPSVRCSSRWA